MSKKNKEDAEDKILYDAITTLCSFLAFAKEERAFFGRRSASDAIDALSVILEIPVHEINEWGLVAMDEVK